MSATTCLLLLVGLTVSWYVLRARARSVKVSCGAPTWRIVVEDYVSLLRVSLPPAGIALLSAFAVLCLTGRVSFVLEFAQLILGFIEGMFAAMLLTALVISACTWPAVDGIASRRPPERHFRVISEALKAAALIIIALSLPAIGAGIASATQLSEQGARWAALDGQVSIRVRAGHPLNVPIGGNPAGSAPAADPLDRMDPLVAAAQAAGKLTFSYSERAEDDAFVTNEGATGFGEFDGYAMVNPNYLAAVASLIGLTPTAERPLGDLAEEIDVDQLPRTLSRYFLDSYPLWNRDGRTLDGFAERFTFYRYVGPTSFPGLHPGLSRMDDLRNPVIVVIDDPSSTFTPQFLGSTLSSGNLIFSDADWVRDYLTHSPIGADILSIDRGSDSGLFSSQQAHQTAGVQAVSYALVVLALVASIAVSAWIHALARGRRTFVQRTAGWTWPRVLLARLGWEAALAVVVTGVVLGLGLSGGNPDMWWVVVVIPLYLAISGLVHLHAVRRVFTARVARVE
ncbi:hypothetical protein ACL9RL_05580 [Plantibacter sp. Mn2098]|uniref:hypothetical protein n=1 Tax=Plantibacter sp. Mn2098 TaxID=3395266 RepID=UPI003BB9B774